MRSNECAAPSSWHGDDNGRIPWLTPLARFIPYLIAIFFIAIPVLMLEIAIGQAFRGGTVIAYNNLNQKLKGVGLAVIYVAFTVTPYFVVNLACKQNPAPQMRA